MRIFTEKYLRSYSKQAFICYSLGYGSITIYYMFSITIQIRYIFIYQFNKYLETTIIHVTIFLGVFKLLSLYSI